MLRAFSTLALLVLFVPAASADEVTLRLRANAVVSYPEYTLHEVAQVEGASAGLTSKLGALRVGVAPRVGYEATLTRAELMQRLMRAHPPVAFALEGPSVVRIRARAQRRADTEAVAAAREALEKRWARGFSRIELAPATEVGEMTLPAGRIEYVARTVDKAVNARMSVLVDVAVEGRHYTTLPVWFSVKAYQRVRVAQRMLGARSIPGEREFRVEERDVAGLRGRAVAADADIEGQWLLRPVAAGSVLTRADIGSMPAVRRDERVTVEVLSRGMRIEARGRALSDGRVGEVVQIQALSPGTRYFATVIGSGTVQVR